MPEENEVVTEQVVEEAKPSLADAMGEALGTQEGAEAPVEAGKPAEDTVDGSETKTGPQRDEKGRFAGLKPKDDPEAKPVEEKPDQEVSDDDLIKDMKPRTAERFQKLREETIEYKARTEQAESVVQNFQQVMQQTGASPEEMGTLFRYAHLVHQDDPTAWREARDILVSEVRALSQRLGEEMPGIDPLDEHPDLKQQVDQYTITREHALAEARLRAIDKQVQARQQRTRMEQESNGSREQAQMKAGQDLRVLGDRLFRTDPDYQAKVDLLVEKTVPWIKANLPPEQWAGAFQQSYDLLNIRTQSAPRQNAGPSPLRANANAGGGMPKPKSAAEAIEQALA